MTTDHLQYALQSGAWFLGGMIASALYQRWYYHRLLVAAGRARKEAPLALFVAVITMLVVGASVLLTEATQLDLNSYVRCSSKVTQRNVETINDRTHSAITQVETEISKVQKEIRFYSSIAATLTQPDGPRARAGTLAAIQVQIEADRQQIAADQKRVHQLQTTPLQPITDCHTSTANR